MINQTKKEPVNKVAYGIALLGLISVAAVAILSSGCTVTKYNPKTGEFSTRSFATRKTIGDLTLGTDTNGVKNLRVRGYSNDQASIIEGAIDAAVKAGAKYGSGGLAPTP